MADTVPACDMRSDKHLVTCVLPKGHVKTRDDWHEGFADTGTHVKTSIYEVTTTSHEHIRWAPNLFELPKEALTKELSP